MDSTSHSPAQLLQYQLFQTVRKTQCVFFSGGAGTAGVMSNRGFDKSQEKSNVKKYIRDGLVQCKKGSKDSVHDALQACCQPSLFGLQTL